MVKTSLRIPLIAIIAHAGCSAGNEMDAAPDVPNDVLTVEQSIGATADAQPAYEFGRIAGVALLDDGRIAVVDGLNHEVRVFDEDGTHSFSFGRNGAGPGEFDGPCCIAIDDRQRLWVRDGGNSRYSFFEIAGDRATFLGQVRMAHGDVNRWAPVTFDTAGHVIDIGMRSDPVTREPRTYRMHLDSTGRIVTETAIHKVADDSTAVKKLHRETSDGTITVYAFQPFGPNELDAHSPTGEFVHALSSRYAIDWRAADGTLIRTLERPFANGPELTGEERTIGEERLEHLATSLDVPRAQLGFGLPSHGPVIQDMFYDRDGRLWVELQVSRGSDRRADVYDTTGTLQRTVTWPAGISLGEGVIRGDVVWGIGRDSLDVPTLVRLTGLGTPD